MFCFHGKLKRNCVLCMQRESLKIQQAQLEMARMNFAHDQEQRSGNMPAFEMTSKKRRRPHVFRWIVLGMVALVIASNEHISPFVGPGLIVAVIVWGLWLWRRHRGDGVSLDDDEPVTKRGSTTATTHPHREKLGEK